jgi:hypothetical protein
MRPVAGVAAAAAVIICTATFAAAQGTGTPAGAAAPGQRPQRPPENLKVLPPTVTIQREMMRITAALGVKCDFCHVQGNFPSDEKKEKQMARRMMQMVKALNANFPNQEVQEGDSVLGSAISCYTCHRGEQRPATNPPAAPKPVG